MTRTDPMAPPIASPVTITLRAKFPVEHAARLWRWLNTPREPNFDDFGPTTWLEFDTALGKRIAYEKTWAVCIKGEAIGYLAFAPQNPVAGQFHGLVLDPKYRDKGLGRVAMQMAIDELVAAGYRSFLSMPTVDNKVIAKLLLALQFRHVGTLRKASQRDGQPSGVAIYCLEVD